MRPLNALQRTLSTAIREPVVLGVAALVALLQIPILLSQLLPPLYAVFVSLGANLVVLVLAPFTQGGLLGLADSALDGEGDLRTFLRAGREHYVSLFAAYLVLIGVVLLAGVATLVLLAVAGAGFGAVAAGVSGAPGVMLPGGIGIVFAGVVALVALAYLVAFLFVQFYAQAIVVDDYSVTDSFTRSASLVRQHLLSTLGYSLVSLVIGGLAGAVVGVSSTVVGNAPNALDVEFTSPAVIAGILLLVVVLSTLSSAFTSLYSVAFYRDISPNETDGVSQL
jgi:hypothetical protein